jgi:hypothetical protein
MKKLIFILSLLAYSWSAAEILEVTHLEPSTRVAIEQSLNESSDQLIARIKSKSWEPLYLMASESIKNKVSAKDFVTACNYDGASGEIELLSRVVLVRETDGAIQIFAQCIYAETNRSKLHWALTWSYDTKAQKWEPLNLPFERFKYLPLVCRYRF